MDEDEDGGEGNSAASVLKASHTQRHSRHHWRYSKEEDKRQQPQQQQQQHCGGNCLRRRYQWKQQQQQQQQQQVISTSGVPFFMAEPLPEPEAMVAASSSSSRTTTTSRPPRLTTTTSASTTIHPHNPQEIEFYRNYNPMDGVVTATVLGGFFAFVCLLVLYKTKCKPMWKNRRKRLTNTPATHSVVETEPAAGGGTGIIPQGTANYCQNQPTLGLVVEGQQQQAIISDDILEEDEEEDYEFIPLRSVFAASEGGDQEGCGSVGVGGAGEDVEEDIYFLDEFGNYVFPVDYEEEAGYGEEGGLESGDVSAAARSCCSCPHEEGGLATRLRRQSQVRSNNIGGGDSAEKRSLWRQTHTSVPGSGS